MIRSREMEPKTESRHVVLADLKRDLLTVVRKQSPGVSEADALRSAVRLLTASAGHKIDQWWKRGRVVRGRIDVIDLFCGCGGMSAGFMAANSVADAFSLA